MKNRYSSVSVMSRKSTANAQLPPKEPMQKSNVRSPFWLQTKALLLKDLMIMRRSWISMTIRFILPLIALLLTFWVTHLFSNKADEAMSGVMSSFGSRDDLCGLGKVFSASDNPVGKAFVQTIRMLQSSDSIPSVELKNQNLDKIDYFKSCGAVVFQDADSDEIHYTLHVKAGYTSRSELTTLAMDANVVKDFESSSEMSKMQAIINMFLILYKKKLIVASSDKALQQSLIDNEDEIRKYALSFKTLLHSFDSASKELKKGLYVEARGGSMQATVQTWVLFVFMSVAILTLSSCIAGRILTEKKLKIQDALRAQGILSSSYYCSVIINMAVLSFCSMILPAGLWFAGSSMMKTFPDNNAAVFFLVTSLCLYNCMALFTLLTFPFQAPSPAKLYIKIFLLLSFVVLFALTSSGHALRAASLHPLVSLFYACRTMLDLSRANLPNNFLVTESQHSLSLLEIVMMNLCGIFTWQVLWVYADLLTVEGNSWYSMFLCCRSTNDEDDFQSTHRADMIQEPSAKEANERVVQLCHVSKRYGNFTAVNNINLTMYSGNIFVLLGHNGAGKTTAFSMMSGMIPVSSGTINIFGRSLKDHLKYNRADVGLCTQKNIVWPNLTVNDHLRLFCSLKGLSARDALDDIDKILQQVGIANKKQALVSTLSGGMVRKLCLAIALLGNPSLLLLDEPTSGMDTTARSELWEVLLAVKRDRVVIMTTHYMDEADALGDRVAIMHHGQVACNGSPDFLKEKYGCGYNVTCLMNMGCGEREKTSAFGLISQQCKSAKILSSMGREMTVTIPFSDVERLPSIFAVLDDRLNSHVESYSVAVSNLEEVFLKVAEEDAEKSSPDKTINRTNDDNNSACIGGVASKSSCLSQLGACIVKNLYFIRRQWLSNLMTLVLPLCIMALALVSSSKPPTIAVSLSIPDKNNSMYAKPLDKSILVLGDGSSDDTKKWKDILLSRPNAGDDQNSELHSLWKKRKITPLIQAHAWYGVVTFEDDGSFGMFPNLYARDSPLMMMQMICNVLIEALDPKDKFRIHASRETLSKNDDLTKSQAPDSNPFEVSTRVFIKLLVPLALSVIILALFSMRFFYYEKDANILTHQESNGLRIAPRWIAQWISDVILLLLTMLILYALLMFAPNSEPYRFREPESGVPNFPRYTDEDQWLFTLYLFLLCACAMPWFLYSLDLPFRRSSPALGFFVLLFNVVVVPARLITWVNLKSDHWKGEDGDSKIGDLITIQNVCSFITGLFLLNPLGALLTGLSDLSSYRACNTRANDVIKAVFSDYPDTIWEGSMMTSIWILCIQLLVWPGVVFAFSALVRSSTWKGYWNAKAPPLAISSMKDSDVVEEEMRVAHMQSHAKETPIFAMNVRKVYKQKTATSRYVHAVQGVSFAAQTGEVFGLLGVNGAGKSTLFQMLAGETMPISEPNVSLSVDRSRGVGYCPQIDPLWPLLTCSEHLTYVCRLRGIDSSSIPSLTLNLMKALDLDLYENVQSDKLSGGNKRKLCLAMSLIGTPGILFLDEVSAGVDPYSRRFMWRVIHRLTEDDKSTSVVLTTHSMEEAEALCTRTTIMVNGVFRCMGPNARLRDVYGAYNILKVIFSQENEQEDDGYVSYDDFVCTLRGFPLHLQLLHTSATCFSLIHSILMERKQIDWEIHGERIKTSVCSSNAAATWKKTVTQCDAFLSSFCDAFSAATNLPREAVVVEKVSGNSCCILVPTHVPMKALFPAMINFKKQGVVEDYYLSRASLVSIFNAFASERLDNTSM